MNTLTQTKKYDSLYEEIRKINTTKIKKQIEIPLIKELYKQQENNLLTPKNIISNSEIIIYTVRDEITKRIPKNNNFEDQAKIARIYLN